MDAISFVLGLKSTHLRSGHLTELIYANENVAMESCKVSLYYEGGDEGVEKVTVFTRRFVE